MPSSLEHKLRQNKRPIGWEDLLSMVIDDTCPPGVVARFQHAFRAKPQRADVLLIRARRFKKERIELLPVLYERLEEQNILELKGGSHSVAVWDPTILLGYACQHSIAEWEREKKRRAKLETLGHKLPPQVPAIIKLIFLAPRMTLACHEGVLRRQGLLRPVHEGVWEGEMAGFPLVFLETEVLWPRGGGNTLLQVNTFSGDEAAVRKQMTEEEELIYNRVREFVDESVETLEEELMKTVSQKIRERDQEFRQRMLTRYTVEERLQGLGAEERLQGLNPEDVLRQYDAQERLQGLKAEERLQGLNPREVLAALAHRLSLDELRNLLQANLTDGPLKA